MSRRAYPPKPTLPSQSAFPVGSGGYPGQNPYSTFPGQPPIAAGYPQQPHPPQSQYPVPPSQGGGLPPASTSTGPGLQGQLHGQPVLTHGGYNTSPPTSYQRPAPPPSGGRMSGPPPPPPTLVNSVAAVTQAPPTSVTSMTIGVGQMHLGPQTNGN